MRDYLHVAITFFGYGENDELNGEYHMGNQFVIVRWTISAILSLKNLRSTPWATQKSEDNDDLTTPSDVCAIRHQL
jgi:hypothetical protein